MNELDLTKLPVGTRLKTRDGSCARLLANDIRGSRPIVVVVDGERDGAVFLLKSDGRQEDERVFDWDVVAVERPKHRVRVRLWSYRAGGVEADALHEAESDFPDPLERPLGLLLADQIVEIEENS